MRRSTARSTPCEGLKENVIVGSLIPSGTGAMNAQIKAVATHRDKLILAQKRAESQTRINELSPAAE